MISIETLQLILLVVVIGVASIALLTCTGGMEETKLIQMSSGTWVLGALGSWLLLFPVLASSHRAPPLWAHGVFALMTPVPGLTVVVGLALLLFGREPTRTRVLRAIGVFGLWALPVACLVPVDFWDISPLNLVPFFLFGVWFGFAILFATVVPSGPLARARAWLGRRLPLLAVTGLCLSLILIRPAVWHIASPVYLWRKGDHAGLRYKRFMGSEEAWTVSERSGLLLSEARDIRAGRLRVPEWLRERIYHGDGSPEAQMASARASTALELPPSLR